MQLKIKDIEELVKLVKSEFAYYIADKSIDLDDRWQEFIDAPEYLKNHKDWVHNFVSIGQGAFVHSGWLSHCERYTPVYLNNDHIENMEDLNKPIEQINAFKEEILAANLGSFVYDW